MTSFFDTYKKLYDNEKEESSQKDSDEKNELLSRIEELEKKLSEEKKEESEE